MDMDRNEVHVVVREVDRVRDHGSMLQAESFSKPLGVDRSNLHVVDLLVHRDNKGREEKGIA
jgi:hypothetical protein